MPTVTTITTIATAPDRTALLRLLQLASPTLPVGAYAYSQGLEYAVHAGWVADEGDARDWILGLLEHNLANLDIPVLARLLEAWQQGDRADVLRWTRFLWAGRESAELRAEDRALGVALARLLADLGVAEARSWAGADLATYATLFALAAVAWKIPPTDAAAGYLWAWCENQVAAAIKLVPLGQTAGQRILCLCAERIPALAARGLSLGESHIGSAAPGVAIASARHETQYTRLFRS
ncbi:MAG: urease accessory protein UreF [Gammaproteobacteria bacterium]|jgi:urease accessory protein